MKYIPINIPKEFSGNPIAGDYFRTWDSNTAKKYFQWFMSAKDERIKILEEAVQSTPGFEHWKADFSKESLYALQPWFESVVEKRALTEEEKKLFMRQYNGTIWAKTTNPPEWVVTDLTRSIEHDVGIYFSEVLIKHNPNLSWGQNLTAKRSPDFNRPVVQGQNFSVYGHSIAHGRALTTLKGEQKDWKELYEIWDNHAKKAAQKIDKEKAN